MAYNPPMRAAAYEFYVSLVSQSNTKVFQSNPTLAAGDVKVSKDGGALSNVATLPSAVGSGKVVKVPLSSSEMTADNVTVIFSDAAGSEWCDLVVNVQPVNVSIPAAVKSMDANTLTASALAADAVTEIAAGVPSAGAIADAVWDEALSGHVAAGSAGKALSDAAAAAPPSAGSIADAVWDEALSGHATAGSAGKALSDAQDGDFVAGSAAAALNAKRGYDGIVYGAAVTGTLSATQATTDLTGYGNDSFNGRTLTFTTGSRKGQQTTISDYASGGGLLTFAALTGAPANGDQFFIA